MELILKRTSCRDTFTDGRLYVDGQYYCDTLEPPFDPLRAREEGSKCAIAFGRYRVVNGLSRRYQRLMPMLCEVPGRRGILVHPGNEPRHSEGCILVGRARCAGLLSDSRRTFDDLHQRIAHCYALREAVWITIQADPCPTRTGRPDGRACVIDR